MGRKGKTGMEIARIMILLLLLQLLSFSPQVNALQYLKHECPNSTTYALNSSYQANLHRVLTSLASNSTKSFGSSSAGTSEKIQGLYQCRGDYSLDVCKSCLSNATDYLLRNCPVEKTAVIWYDECLLRFSNETIVSVPKRAPLWGMVDSRQVGEFERAQLISFLRTDLNQCATVAANSQKSKFAVMERRTFANLSFTDTLYYMTLCTDDLSADNCSQCLQPIVDQYLASANINLGARMVTPSCFFRYEIYQFYNSTAVAVPPPPLPSPPLPSPPPPPPPPVIIPASGSNGYTQNSAGTTSNSKVRVLAISIPVGVLCLFFCVVCCFLASRRRARNKHSLAKGTAETVDSLRYDLATLQAATGKFADDNVLGRGGYGEVFKGTLNDGVEIAVKRLAKNSTQGAAEFKNEINSLVNLHHRNLTRLLGYCLESEERILVYEFVPNRSLDYILFDSEKRQLLNWSRRFNIIQGIAQGILYLHEESRLKIIHRDLKASNILLDLELKPRISDFGMAKIFGVDQSHSTTNRVVGTFGYMSPEYAMHGQYSEKSDVYSFGVLVLEVVTGKKNNESSFPDACEDLIGYVWKHWTEQIAEEVVDPALGEMYSTEEVLRCIHIGLLCVQENAMQRPTMTCVVTMLNNYSTALTMPVKPVFFHSKPYTTIQWSDC